MTLPNFRNNADILHFQYYIRQHRRRDFPFEMIAHNDLNGLMMLHDDIHHYISIDNPSFEHFYLRGISRYLHKHSVESEIFYN